MNQDLTKLYEDIQFDHTPNPKSRMVRENERRVEDSSEQIEELISGVITYYKQLKRSSSLNITDMTPIEELEQLSKFLTPHLAQFKEFK